MKQIGNLFILRININLVGSILDSPVSRFLPPSLFRTPLIPAFFFPLPLPSPRSETTGILLDIPRPRTTLQRRPVIPRNRPTCRTLKRPCRCFAGYAQVVEGECEFESWREVGGYCHFLNVRPYPTRLVTDADEWKCPVELRLSSVSSPFLSISVSRRNPDDSKNRHRVETESRSRLRQEAQICNK